MGIAQAFGSAVIAIAALVGALLIVGGALYRLFGMWITDRVISGPEFALIASILLVLMGGAIAVGGPLSLGLLLLVAALGLLISLLPQISQRIRGHRMMRDDIRRYEAALKRQPDVPFPHLKLAEIYRQQEDWDRAIEHYQAYIEQHEINADAKRALERCLERKRIRDMGLRRCPICGAENPHSNVRCDECGFYLKGSAEIMDALTSSGMMRVWKWLIVIFLIPAVALGMLQGNLSAAVSVAMFGVCAIAAFMFLYGRMRPEGR